MNSVFPNVILVKTRIRIPGQAGNDKFSGRTEFTPYKHLHLPKFMLHYGTYMPNKFEIGLDSSAAARFQNGAQPKDHTKFTVGKPTPLPQPEMSFAMSSGSTQGMGLFITEMNSKEFKIARGLHNRVINIVDMIVVKTEKGKLSLCVMTIDDIFRLREVFDDKNYVENDALKRALKKALTEKYMVEIGKKLKEKFGNTKLNTLEQKCVILNMAASKSPQDIADNIAAIRSMSEEQAGYILLQFGETMGSIHGATGDTGEMRLTQNQDILKALFGENEDVEGD